MKANTQTTSNFEIRIDGELVTPTLSEQAIAIGNTALTHFQAVSAVFAAKAGQYAISALKELTTPVLLDIHDHMHGSTLRDEYFQRKHELATTAMRESVDIFTD